MLTIVTPNIRGYKSEAARKNAIHMLSRCGKANYFVPFRDVQSEFALQFGLANWVRPGEVHVDGGWCGGKRPSCSRPWSATE